MQGRAQTLMLLAVGEGMRVRAESPTLWRAWVQVAVGERDAEGGVADC